MMVTNSASEDVATTGTTPHAISEYRSSRMTDNAGVAEKRKWEVAKEEQGGRRGRIGGKG